MAMTYPDFDSESHILNPPDDQELADDQKSLLSSKKPVIAISGKSGCGNTTVTTLLSEFLGFRMINYTFRNLAKDLDIPLMDLIEKAKTDDKYDRQVDTKQVELAKPGNTVLGSRLAIWVYPDAQLKIYLTADSLTRAKRIHNREGGDLLQIQQETQKRDQEDQKRYLDLYGIDTNQFDFVDLVIDTAKYTPEQIVNQIARALYTKLQG